MDDFDDDTIAALAKTEKLLNALEAIRGRVGVTDIGAVVDLYKLSMKKEDMSEMIRQVGEMTGTIVPAPPPITVVRRRPRKPKKR